MEIKSYIGIINPDTTIDYIYCHQDGYPSHAGKILINHYQDIDRVNALMALGDLSYLAPEIGEERSFDDGHENWCVAYGRDGGYSKTGAKNATYETLINDESVDYVYIFDNEFWECYSIKDKKPIPLYKSKQLNILDMINNIAKNKFTSSGAKLGEYLLFIGLACLIVYFLMKSIFGSPSFTEMEANTKLSNGKLDTVLNKQDEYQVSNYEALGRIEEAQSFFIKVLNDNNRLIQQSNSEISKLKKLLYEKPKITNTIPSNKKINLNSTNYRALDSFFSNRYQKLYGTSNKR